MALGNLSDFSSLTNSQANQSVSAGNVGARLADPFMNERPQYQNALSKLVSDPGSFASSPYYKFAYEEGLNALSRKGNVRSGNKLAALMQYGQDRASQSYFPQAQLLAGLATQGSNPGAAAMSAVGGYNRSQDQKQIAAAQGVRGSGGGAPQTPWYMNPNQYAEQDAYRAANFGTPMPSYGGGTSLPSGGYGSTYGGSSYGGYAPDLSFLGQGYRTPGVIDESGAFGGSGYAPSYDYSAYSGYGDDYNDGYGGYDYSSDWGY
jgi:hypothetical protein